MYSFYLLTYLIYLCIIFIYHLPICNSIYIYIYMYICIYLFIIIILRILPKSVGNMQNLRHLNISRNQLQDLPAELTCCRNLRVLNVRHNNLLFLPGELCWFSEQAYIYIYIYIYITLN